MAVTQDALFDGEFLKKLEYLRIVSKRMFGGPTIEPTPLATIFAESIGELISDLNNYYSGYSRKSKIFQCISLWIVASL